MKKRNLNIVILSLSLLLLLPTSVAQASIGQDDCYQVLLMGVDTAEGWGDPGRSDVLMVLQIDTDQESVVLASIPRDSYVEIPGYGLDKINHAYAFGGPELSIETVNQWLKTEIASYVVVDMTGLINIMDVVGSISVVPPTSFSIGGYDFVAGYEVDLTPEMALYYARERYSSGGDYARQERQRQILEAIGRKASEIRNPLKLTQLLNVIRKNTRTNLSFKHLYDLFRFYQNNLDQYSIDFHQLAGSGMMIDGIYYEDIFDDSLETLQALLDRGGDCE